MVMSKSITIDNPTIIQFNMLCVTPVQSHNELEEKQTAFSDLPFKHHTKDSPVTAQAKRREPWNPMHPIKAAGDKSFAVPPQYPAVMPVEVADPYGDGKILAMRSVHDDPLASLHAHRQIDDHQFEAGCRYQRDVEVSEQGLRAIDTTRDVVDGGLPPELLSDVQQDASRSRRGAEAAMGLIGAPIAYDIIIGGLSNGQVALKQNGLYYGDGAKCKGGPLYSQYDDPLEFQDQLANRRARETYGRRRVDNIGVLFRSALDCLVIYYGMKTPTRH
jgi:hypothetical protein